MLLITRDFWSAEGLGSSWGEDGEAALGPPGHLPVMFSFKVGGFRGEQY